MFLPVFIFGGMMFVVFIKQEGIQTWYHIATVNQTGLVSLLMSLLNDREKHIKEFHMVQIQVEDIPILLQIMENLHEGKMP